MRERGTQSRRVRGGKVEVVSRPAPPTRGSSNFWQGLAIVALIAATAGWTTVAVLALRSPANTGAAVPSADPNATDNASTPPVVPSHDVPELEAFLPAQVNGTALEAQSVTGDDGLIASDNWGTVMTTFLTGASKTAKDLQYAFASDPASNIDISVGVYRVVSVDANALRDALIRGWKALAPAVKISNVTLGGKDVLKGDDGADNPFSYLYVRGTDVYEIYTSDESLATAALKALPTTGAPGASAAPGAPASPKASVAPAASVPPVTSPSP